MAKDLVLITGATGFLGFQVLLQALEQGYQVRAAVRNEAKAQTITSNPTFKALNRSSQLSFITVPDFLKPGAFDSAVQDVKYIIHVASPLPFSASSDYENSIIQPAVQGTLGVLESAKQSSTVKRIVITSSTLAITGKERDEIFNQVFTAENRQPTDDGPYGDASHAYAASKVAALNRAEEWIQQNKPAFDVIHIHPSFIFGRNDLYTSTKDFFSGTNVLPLAIATGKADSRTTYSMCYNHVADSARAHVLALDEKVQGNQSFMVTSAGGKGEEWSDVWGIVERRYPEAVEKGIFRKGEVFGSREFKADVKKTERAFGFGMASFEEAVAPVFDQFLELLAKESK